MHILRKLNILGQRQMIQPVPVILDCLGHFIPIYCVIGDSHTASSSQYSCTHDCSSILLQQGSWWWCSPSLSSPSIFSRCLQGEVSTIYGVPKVRYLECEVSPRLGFHKVRCQQVNVSARWGVNHVSCPQRYVSLRWVVHKVRCPQDEGYPRLGVYKVRCPQG